MGEEILFQLPELSQFAVGLMHIQLLHTSASLAINENWDPDVRDDMEMMLNRIVPEDVPFRHSCEGPDDMPAHVKACFLGSNLTVPLSDSKQLPTAPRCHNNCCDTKPVVLLSGNACL